MLLLIISANLIDLFTFNMISFIMHRALLPG